MVYSESDTICNKAPRISELAQQEYKIKINVQKSIVLLFISNKQMRLDIKINITLVSTVMEEFRDKPDKTRRRLTHGKLQDTANCN